MSEFKRESRYIVIKSSDLAKVPTAYQSGLVDPLIRLQAHLPNRDFVVVESDWPEYEPVWQMIEARMNGEPNALDAALAREAALQTSLDAVTFNLDKTDKALLALQNIEAALREELANTQELAGLNAKLSVLLQQRLSEAEKQVTELEQDKKRLDLWQSKPVYFGGFAPSGSWSFFNHSGKTCYGKTLREALDQLGVMDAYISASKPVEGEGS